MFLKNVYFAWKALQSHVLSSSPCSLPAFQPYYCCSPATLASFQFLHYNKLFLFFESIVSFAWKIFLLISVLGSLSALMSQFECHLFRETISSYHASVDDPFPLPLFSVISLLFLSTLHNFNTIIASNNSQEILNTY